MKGVILFIVFILSPALAIVGLIYELMWMVACAVGIVLLYALKKAWDMIF